MKELIKQQRAYFNTGVTRSVAFRKKQLKRLIEALLEHQTNLEKALYQDLRKSELEAYSTEIGITIADIEHNIKNLQKWSKPQCVKTPLFFMPGKSRIHAEPYGVALVIAPWNYPIKNLLGPAIGAIAAGNCVVLKPSEVSVNTSKALKVMFDEFFDKEYIHLVEGGVEETSQLLEEKFDYIFFTGGTQIGKIIYQAAAKQLTPCTLELGGKSPSIVDKDVNLEVTAKRLVWGKFLNAGQVCVAPDYVFVHQEIKEKLIVALKAAIKEMHGENPKQSPFFGRIISDRHFERISKLIEGDIVEGGETDASEKYIAPTIINNVKAEDKVMQEEIFGPIIPILTYNKVDEVVDFINKGEKPLAMYIFSKNKQFRDTIINNTSAGGVCINETVMHMVSPEMPFGGVGDSGNGSYNGIHGFNTFSHKKPVMTRSFLFDVPQKYPPYTTGKAKFLKFALKRLL